MKIAVASGKGGTGKTLVSVNLAVTWEDEGSTALIDCDVEAPNDHLFLHPEIVGGEEVQKKIPRIDEALCTRCGACTDACEFHALARVGPSVIVFEELCHGCGRCGLVCPAGAIAEQDHRLGVVEWGASGGIGFVQGRLDIGERMASPLIRRAKQVVPAAERMVFDAPPGTACSVIAAVSGMDAVLLVTEPTPFGLHDLRAAARVVSSLGIPASVVINRCETSDHGVEAFCREFGLPVLLKIPFDREIAEICAEGGILVREKPEWRKGFKALAQRVSEAVQ